MSSILEAYFGSPLAPGAAAPAIDAADHTGTPVKLPSGTPTVLVFYPGDDTPGCTRQLCEFRDSWSAYGQAGVAVYGVNPQGPASHGRFIGKYGFPFPILVDRGGRIANAYRCGGLLVRRTVYAIGADGRIAFSRRGMPAPEAVLAVLRGGA